MTSKRMRVRLEETSSDKTKEPTGQRPAFAWKRFYWGVSRVIEILRR
jgi:hypothetical protein